MKHLKIFENINQNYWLMIYDIKDGDTSYSLFSDKESCENYIITIINDERQEHELTNDNNYTNDMFFVDIGEALDWYDDTIKDATINYVKLTSQPKFEGSDKLIQMRQTRKYNL